MVVSILGGDDDVYRALRAGAACYMFKDAPREELFACIRATHAGRVCLAPVAAARLTVRLGAAVTAQRER